MDQKRIQDAIRELARNIGHVRFREIENLLDKHIGPRFPNYNHHGCPHHAFTVGASTFNIAEPRKGHFVKPVYVRSFLEAMEAIGMYQPEDTNGDS